MNAVVSVGKVIRHWSDVSHKVIAAGLGGSSSALVLTVLDQVFPNWHPGTLITGILVAAVSVASAYMKGETVSLDVNAGDEETTITLPELPDEVRTAIEGEAS